MTTGPFHNPFRPGAGHMPIYLAGRENEKIEFSHLLKQDVILQNLILTGLRGVGKTVLLETLKPLSIAAGWLWVGTDLSETSSISENNLCTRILADLSVITSSVIIGVSDRQHLGFLSESSLVHTTLDFEMLRRIFEITPGLPSDKLKAVLEFTWAAIKPSGRRGVVFAYDEAQNLADHSAKEEYPLSLLLDVFQSLQRKNMPYILALSGLPTLFPKLVEARTYSERMFHVMFLNQLNDTDSRAAILRPIEVSQPAVAFDEHSVSRIVGLSGGYPYFIQFICREVFDAWIQNLQAGKEPRVSFDAVIRKLDADFFAGRWARVTDRQRELLSVVASLENSNEEFTVQEVVKTSRGKLEKPFSSSHVNQIFSSLISSGLIYRNRHGRYSFAVPLLADFIKRQQSQYSLFS